MTAMQGIAQFVADGAVLSDPSRTAAYRCQSGHLFSALALDGHHREQFTCRARASRTAVCGAQAGRVADPTVDGGPVVVVTARRGREVEWLKPRRWS